MSTAYCQNCDWTGPATDVLPDIPGYHERVDDPTDVLGECPECRCLAYADECDTCGGTHEPGTSCAAGETI
jgi:hypothetical protein